MILAFLATERGPALTGFLGTGLKAATTSQPYPESVRKAICCPWTGIYAFSTLV